MKKDLFKIDSDEVKRILSLHEERSKNQYLGILSEQNNQFKVSSYTTTKINGLRDPYKDKAFKFIPQNTKFESTKDSKIVTAKNVSIKNKNGEVVKNYENVRVSFHCAQGKFFVQNDTTGYLSEGLAQSLVKNVCGRVNYKTKIATSGTKFTQPKYAGFSSPNKIGFTTPINSVWVWDGKQATTKTNNGEIVTFKCYTGKFNYLFEKNGVLYKNSDGLRQNLQSKFCKVKDVQNNPTVPTSGTTTGGTTSGTTTGGTTTQQKTPLTDAQKLDKAKKCGHNTWEEYKNSKWACTPPQQVKTPDSVGGGQIASQTATVTKQVQTSLGSKTPTGKITDAELDAILAKLG